MLSKILTGALAGLEAGLVTVETDMSAGLPALTIVGLPDATVRESKERIRSAIENSGFDFPHRRITINLAPASSKKEGSHFDLPIALGILDYVGDMRRVRLEKTAFIGELSLDGTVNRIDGALPLVIGLRRSGIRTVVLPKANIFEASVIRDMEFVPVSSLAEVVSYMTAEDSDAERMTYFPQNENSLAYEDRSTSCGNGAVSAMDYGEIFGQEAMKRVMTICAAGAHGLVMVGPPGSGKSMLAKRLPTILPPLTYEEMLECTQIYSVAGKLSETLPMISERPFRAPHHSITQSALMGGGYKPRPGEISLAHNGVLFLDELPEFSTKVIETLRQPIEDGQVVITRQGGNLTFPCRCILIAASNPCRCGYYGDSRHRCTCSASSAESYMNKLSGPLLERMDLQAEVRAVEYAEILKFKLEAMECRKPQNLTSAQMREMVMRAIEIQRQRYKDEGILYNSQLTNHLIDKYCDIDNEGEAFIKSVFDKFALSARTYNKVLKVARTIADLEGAENIGVAHLAEAVNYRQLDRRRR